MSRNVHIVDPIVDQFPVWNLDCETKKSGETTFSALVWRDGVKQSVSVTISEILTTPGEYRIEFQPDAPGFWTCEVLIPFNGQRWFGEYEVNDAVQWGASMADDQTDATFGVWIDVDGQRLTDVDQVTATLIDTAGAAIYSWPPNTTPTAEGIFEFKVSSATVARHVPYALDVEGERNGIAWYANIGLAKA